MQPIPIRRNEHITPLSREHHDNLLFCWKIRQGIKLGIERKRMEKYVHYFWQNHIEPHFELEESLLFTDTEDEYVQKVLLEHQQIKTQMETAMNAAGGLACQQLGILADMVDNHIRYEERVVFPHLEKIFNSEQMEDIGRQLKEKRSAKPDDCYADGFWMKRSSL